MAYRLISRRRDPTEIERHYNMNNARNFIMLMKKEGMQRAGQLLGFDVVLLFVNVPTEDYSKLSRRIT